MYFVVIFDQKDEYLRTLGPEEQPEILVKDAQRVIELYQPFWPDGPLSIQVKEV